MRVSKRERERERNSASISHFLSLFLSSPPPLLPLPLPLLLPAPQPWSHSIVRCSIGTHASFSVSLYTYYGPVLGIRVSLTLFLTAHTWQGNPHTHALTPKNGASCSLLLGLSEHLISSLILFSSILFYIPCSLFSLFAKFFFFRCVHGQKISPWMEAPSAPDIKFRNARRRERERKNHEVLFLFSHTQTLCTIPHLSM